MARLLETWSWLQRRLCRYRFSSACWCGQCFSSRHAVIVLQVSGTDIPRLTDWTDDTLDAGGSYTTGSDVHQLGVLLWKWLSLPTAASADSAGQASDLVKVLKSKTDAHAALDHAWLNSVPETSSM